MIKDRVAYLCVEFCLGVPLVDNFEVVVDENDVKPPCPETGMKCVFLKVFLDACSFHRWLVLWFAEVKSPPTPKDIRSPPINSRWVT